jgi:hypothetical protein
VVAHSLGCVVAYDMLRTYFSRVCGKLPAGAAMQPTLDEMEAATLKSSDVVSKADMIASRAKARELVRRIVDATAGSPDEKPPARWLVTDFVTLGNAMAQARFLMCHGETRSELEQDFARRVLEREFPTCPPMRLDAGGLTFVNPKTEQRVFHHGAMFGLTRWTNIYFPRVQILWGDALAGPVANDFGSHIVDVPVWTNVAKTDEFFTHQAYWDVDRKEGRNAPHIVALRKAVDLADLGTANELIP